MVFCLHTLPKIRQIWMCVFIWISRAPGLFFPDPSFPSFLLIFLCGVMRKGCLTRLTNVHAKVSDHRVFLFSLCSSLCTYVLHNAHLNYPLTFTCQIQRQRILDCLSKLSWYFRNVNISVKYLEYVVCTKIILFIKY